MFWWEACISQSSSLKRYLQYLTTLLCQHVSSPPPYPCLIQRIPPQLFATIYPFSLTSAASVSTDERISPAAVAATLFNFELLLGPEHWAAAWRLSCKGIIIDFICTRLTGLSLFISAHVSAHPAWFAFERAKKWASSGQRNLRPFDLFSTRPTLAAASTAATVQELWQHSLSLSCVR